MKKYKLTNGLTVLLTPQKETKAITVLVLVGVGSRYESENIAGVAHFLEHMMFKGTKKRPTHFSIVKELDGVGAQYNAYTDKDHTGYYIKINAEKIDLALDILSDIVWNSKLEEKEISKEKGAILEEINMYEDRPADKAGENLEKLIFNNNSLGKDILGNKKTVSNTNRREMLVFKNKYYHPKNMVVSVAGNFNEEKIEKKINKYFDKKFNKNKKTNFKKFNFEQKKPTISLEYKDSAQAHLAIGFKGISYINKENSVVKILSTILGSGTSSRLFVNIREKYGLCYYIFAGSKNYQDTGIFYIQSGLDKDRIKLAIKLIIKELKKIKEKGITSEELKRAKENIKGNIILNLEDSENIASWYGTQQLLIGKTKTPEQKIYDIMKVNKEDVNRVAKGIFKTSKINLAMIGPFKDEKQFKKLLKI